MNKSVTDQIAELVEFVDKNLPELAGDLLHLYDMTYRREAGALETALGLIPSIDSNNRLSVVESSITRAALKAVTKL